MTSYTWTVNLSGEGGNPKYNLSEGEQFYFGLVNYKTTTVIGSQYINITDKKAAESIASTSSVSSTSASASVSQTVPSTFAYLPAAQTSSSAATTPSTSSPIESTKGMSTGEKAGIGVGAIVGVLVIIGAFALGYFLRTPKSTLDTTDAPIESYFAPSIKTRIFSQVVEAPDSEVPKPHNRVYEI